MCVQVHVPTRGGIARFVVVSEQFCAFGSMAWGPQKSPHEHFFGIVRFVEVSEPFWTRFCVLSWFRTDLGGADVMRMQDVGAGIARFVVISEQFGVSCRTAGGSQKEHPRWRFVHRCHLSNVGLLDRSIRDGDSSIAAKGQQEPRRRHSMLLDPK